MCCGLIQHLQVQHLHAVSPVQDALLWQTHLQDPSPHVSSSSSSLFGFSLGHSPLLHSLISPLFLCPQPGTNNIPHGITPRQCLGHHSKGFLMDLICLIHLCFLQWHWVGSRGQVSCELRAALCGLEFWEELLRSCLRRVPKQGSRKTHQQCLRSPRCPSPQSDHISSFSLFQVE